MKVKRICIICKKEFWTKTNNKKTCSFECSLKYQELKRIERLKPKTKKLCVICEREFLTSMYHKKTCSNKCSLIHRKNSQKLYKRSKRLRDKLKKEQNRGY